jgi:hypothetical protein
LIVFPVPAFSKHQRFRRSSTIAAKIFLIATLGCVVLVFLDRQTKGSADKALKAEAVRSGAMLRTARLVSTHEGLKTPNKVRTCLVDGCRKA